MNWGRGLKKAFEDNGDDFSKMITTLTDEELIAEFYDGFGGTEGVPFTAWGEKFVYFPIRYDGAEWVGSAPRNPCEIKCEHQGGG
jgi:hypothetical protein